MSRQRPTEAEIAESIGLPHSRRQDAGQEPSTDPIMPTPMVVEVERIKAYDHNPRQVTNSEYEAIKESIQAAGMEQTLTITRRPGDERYMMAAGANSRLRAVQELWRETGEERFRSIPCLFRPWTDEVDMLAGHLRESIYGPLTFIDRARAIRHLRELIEAETGQARLSHAAS